MQNCKQFLFFLTWPSPIFPKKKKNLKNAMNFAPQNVTSPEKNCPAILYIELILAIPVFYRPSNGGFVVVVNEIRQKVPPREEEGEILAEDWRRSGGGCCLLSRQKSTGGKTGFTSTYSSGLSLARLLHCSSLLELIGAACT